MASKYINIEDAATRLKMTVDELNKMREQGSIRAFSDRGTWKFKADDIEELARNQDADSGFDIPSSDIIKDDQISASETGPGSKISLDEEVGDLPTVISKQSPNEPPSSDSDVRLVVDPSLDSDSWDAAVEPASSESSVEADDSDVRFVDASMSDVTPTPIRLTEGNEEINVDDSDDRWTGISDSDVRLSPVGDDGSDSDSDVTLQESDQDSGDEMRPPSDMVGDLGSLEDSDSDVTLVGDTEDDPHSSDFRLSGIDVDDVTDGPVSDIALMPPDDDSGIRLEEVPDDQESILSDVMSDPSSGLSFSSGDSGLSLDLALDSGISLDDGSDDDSITLAADSGISLVPDSGSGLTLADDNEQGGATIPMMGTLEEDVDDTSFDMPLLEDSTPETPSDDETGVVMFDDDESGETMEFDSSELSGQDEFVDFDDDDDSFAELSDGELDVSDELLDDDDVLEADDADFEDEFESGESVPALAVPGGVRGGGTVAASADWDMVSFSLVLLSTLMMAVCTMLMFDLVRSMWGFAEPNGINGAVLDMLKGLIE